MTFKNRRISEGKKLYYTQDRVGSSKYTISYHDGVSTHKDGSPFYGIMQFNNRKNYEKAIKDLESKGYTERGFGMGENLIVSKLRKIIKEEYRKIVAEAGGAVDKDAVDELCLFADNDRKMYDVLHKTYVPALMKFKKRGNFDRNKALKLLEYYYQNYVRPAYKKEYGGDVPLNPASRKMFAEHFLSNLEDEGYLDLNTQA